MNVKDELHQQTSYNFIAAVLDVYNETGNGFFEEVYRENLGLKLTDRKIPFFNQPSLTLRHEGRVLKKQYQPDLIIVGEIVVELKAVKFLAPEHKTRLINWLRATRQRIGYLINLAAFPRLERKRSFSNLN